MRLVSILLASALTLGPQVSGGEVAPAGGTAVPVDLASPDGRITLTFGQRSDGTPTYAVARDGLQVLAPSVLGLTLDIGGDLGPGLMRTNASRRDGEDRYRPVTGKTSLVRKPWREMTIDLDEPAARPDSPARRMRLVFRAYDDGVAFRYVVPTDHGLGTVGLRSEATQFAFPSDYLCWGLNLGRFDTAHEGEFDPVRASLIRDHHAYDAPLVCETGAGSTAFALAEADLKDYAALYLAGRGDGRLGVQAKLPPRLDERTVSVRTRIGSPLMTPWRVIMIGDSAGELIESTLVADLSPDPAFATGWIEPGKSAWDWWNGGQIALVPASGMNTATFKALIDFAAANDLKFVTVDEGWYLGAGGGRVVRPGADVTRHNPEVDIPYLVDYARERDVGLMLWVNWQALDAQFEAALDQYRAWGIAGIKVDFMDRDDQQMVDWFHKLLSQAAEHRLLVNLHGAYHPTGLYRTYPNFLTQEGVLGAEYNKWSARVTATHNVTIPYTRMLLGPIDYTPGGFRNVAPADFQNQFILPTVMTTRAHGLAMFVVYDSPLATVADTPDAYDGQPEFTFIRQVPTTWDETRFLSGQIGQSIVLARRGGRDWYVGAMTNETGRTVQIPLDFLGFGRFDATFYTDGVEPEDAEIETRAVSGGETISLELKPSGGAAIRITPR